MATDTKGRHIKVTFPTKGYLKREGAKAKALKAVKAKGDYKNEAERGADYKKHNILHLYKTRNK